MGEGGFEGGGDHYAACWMSPQRSLVTADGQGPWWNSEGGFCTAGGVEIGRGGWRKTERETEIKQWSLFGVTVPSVCT